MPKRKYRVTIKSAILTSVDLTADSSAAAGKAALAQVKNLGTRVSWSVQEPTVKNVKMIEYMEQKK